MPSSKYSTAPMTVELKNKMGLMAVLSSLSYSFCSVSMVMSNKVRERHTERELLVPFVRC